MKIRFILFLVLAAVIAGCSAPPKQQVQVQVEPSVRPMSLVHQPLKTYSDQQMALTLLNHYQTGPAYSLSVPLELSGYQPSQALRSPDHRQWLQLFQKENRWGFVSVVTGRNPIMNGFELTDEKGGKSYALVLKNAKICLVAGAARAPFWGGSSWVHSTVNPGKFECSGQTRGSMFTPYSGMPGRLGVYFMSGDTVLYENSRENILNLADYLSHQFTHLSVPVIN